MTIVLIEPLNNDPSAVEATERTLQMLPGVGSFERDANNALIWQDGKLRLRCSFANFVVFAAVRQGYVRSAVKETP